MENINDLKASLEIEKIILDNAKRYRERLLQIYSPSGYPSDTSIKDRVKTGSSLRTNKELYDLVSEIHRYDSLIYIQECRINKMENEKIHIKQLIDNMKRIKYKIYYMQKMEGKTLKDISVELGYNYGYIRNIAAKI